MQYLERSVIIRCRATGRFWGPFPGRKRVWEKELGLATRYFTQEGADAALQAACADSPQHGNSIGLAYWDELVAKQQAAE